MITILEQLLVFFIATPLGFASLLSLLIGFEFLITKNILKDRHNGYVIEDITEYAYGPTPKPITVPIKHRHYKKTFLKD
jgi:hypothetical protein